jgi:hypothetical protein
VEDTAVASVPLAGKLCPNNGGLTLLFSPRVELKANTLSITILHLPSRGDSQQKRTPMTTYETDDDLYFVKGDVHYPQDFVVEDLGPEEAERNQEIMLPFISSHVSQWDVRSVNHSKSWWYTC